MQCAESKCIYLAMIQLLQTNSKARSDELKTRKNFEKGSKQTVTLLQNIKMIYSVKK